jgi:hypothetical protein
MDLYVGSFNPLEQGLGAAESTVETEASSYLIILHMIRLV